MGDRIPVMGDRISVTGERFAVMGERFAKSLIHTKRLNING